MLLRLCRVLRRWRLAGFVLLAAAATSCVDVRALDISYVEREEKRFTVSGRPQLDLSTFDGSIEIRAWDQPEVLVTVEKRAVDKTAASSIEVNAEQSANEIRVSARAPEHWSFTWPAHRSARLIVSVPAASDVRATSGDGSIDIERINGRVALRSGDGSIRTRELTGSMQFQTGDGSITVEAADGDLDVMTGDGSVRLDGRFSRVRARTGDGSLRVAAAPGSSTASEWDIRTGDGSVTLEIPDGFGGEIDAHTNDGRIVVRDVTVSNVAGGLARNTLRGTLGAGGKSVRVQTGDGSITLRRR